MARVFFKQKTLNKEVSERLYLDLVSSTKGKRTKTNKLGESYDDHIVAVRRVVQEAAEGHIQKLLKDHYVAALDDIRDEIKKGIPGEEGNGTLKDAKGRGWASLNKKYFKRKVLNKRKFWKHSGDTAFAYSLFAKGYRANIKSNKNITHYESSGRKFRGFRDRIKLDFRVPKPPQGGAFFETILHDSFFYEDSESMGSKEALSELQGTGMETIAFMEGFSSSSKYRPFIAKRMGKAGRDFHDQLDSLLLGARKQGLEKTVGKALASVRFKEY